jgi:hypothetical protein
MVMINTQVRSLIMMALGAEQIFAAESLCRECTPFPLGENVAGSNSKGGDREYNVIEDILTENVKCSETAREMKMTNCGTVANW